MYYVVDNDIDKHFFVLMKYWVDISVYCVVMTVIQ